MTNQEKAKQVAITLYSSDVAKARVCFYSALGMAEWKDEQTKAEIDKMIAEQNQNGTAEDDSVLGALKSLKKRLNLE